MGLRRSVIDHARRSGRSHVLRPAAEHGLGVVAVVALQAASELAVRPAAGDLGDAGHGHLVEHHMRGFGDHAPWPFREGGGEEERDRAAVAVAYQDRPVDSARVQHRGQHLLRLALEEVVRPRQARRIRAAVAQALVDEPAAAGGTAERLREVAPLRDRAQPLVQEDEVGRTGRTVADPDRAKALPAGGYEEEVLRRGHRDVPANRETKEAIR